MELYLQFGWGMMEHCRYLIRRWGSGTVILSPRDLKDGQLVALSKQLRQLGGNVLLDPQFYLPHEDHHRLSAHRYWPQEYDSGAFWGGAAADRLLTELQSLNRRLGCKDFILPGLYTLEVNESVLERSTSLIERAQILLGDEFRLHATVALSEQATRDPDQIPDLLEAATHWRTSGVYLISEHPRGDYLVQDPTWLSNVIDLVAGFRLHGKEVILGYSNHQELIAACAPATAIASGTWMNVRMFPPEKFRSQAEEDFRTRQSWYYSSQALSEYAIPYLDVAKEQGMLDKLAPEREFEGGLIGYLFLAPRPSDIGLSEPEAFRHYLVSLASQVQSSVKDSFEGTVAAHERILSNAKELLDDLHAAGVFGQHRDFGRAIDANRSALQLLRSSRGAVLRRNWDTLAS